MCKISETLSRIIEEKKIYSVYQPIVSLENGDIYGFEACLKCKKDFSIMYLDLDNFKAYNDAYGFENGDLIIQTKNIKKYQWEIIPLIFFDICNCIY